MKFAACLGTKDEIDLIGPCIAHLRAIGVTHVLASDAGSTDGTREVLEDMRGPDLDLYHFDDRQTEAGFESRETAKLIMRAREIGADWMIFLDADEFPLPRAGHLSRVEGLESTDVIVIKRFNVPLLADGPAMMVPPGPRLEDVLLYAPDKPRRGIQMQVRQDPSAPWIGVVPSPKVMIRPARLDETSEGHHDAGVGDDQVRRIVAADLIMAHLPFTNPARFARKVDNIRALFAESGHLWGPDSAWHWQRWLQNVDQHGGVAGEIARNTVSGAELAELRQAGMVNTAAQVLSRPRA